MTAQIIQFVPRPNPERDLSYDARLGHLNQMAVEIVNVAPIPSSHDTAPSEYCAPEQDGA